MLIFVVLLIAGVAHGWNMYKFPYFENDEGTYMSQAWSLMRHGTLSPYTYWYDHAPVGWMVTALWLVFTGGPYTFGFSLYSGRVLMLVVHLISTYLLMKISKKITNSYLPGAIGGIIFSLSPLGIYFQRRLLLDNFMIAFVLGSLALVAGPKRHLSHYLLSAILMALAILTKENAVFFIPPLLFIIFTTAHKQHRNFVVAKWLILAGSLTAVYFLYALLKGELFPSGSTLGGDSPHVSLLGTLEYQFSRGKTSIFDIEKSTFWIMAKLWLMQDKFLIIGGLVSTGLVFIIGLFNKSKYYLGISLMSAFIWFFFVRGGLVLEFYIIPTIPLMGLLTGLVIFEILNLFQKITHLQLRTGVGFVLLIGIIGFYLTTNQTSRAFAVNNGGHRIFRDDQVKGQLDAIDWIRNHIDTSEVILFDDYSHLELNDPENPSGIYYPKAVWYWKADLDPQVKNYIMPNGIEDVGYLARTPQMEHDISLGGLPTLNEIMQDAGFVTDFKSYGWGVEIWATRYPEKILKRAWDFYKQKFITDNSITTDPATKTTTSEAQSYTMLRSVWMDDKEVFAKTWNWTRENLMNDSGTFAWKWGQDKTGAMRILDSSTATDGDTDIALALLLASKKWKNPEYENAARQIINGVWEKETKVFGGVRYVVPGDWAVGRSNLILNPSYLSPYAYRIFGDVDPEHDWQSLVDSSYSALDKCLRGVAPGQDKSVNLPPNWCTLNEEGDLISSPEPGLNSSEYSYDAIRTMWRLALDYKWYGEIRAKELLDLSSIFLKDKWNNSQKILVGYTHDGKDFENYESVLGYSTSLANFSVSDPELANEIYKKQVLFKYYEDFETNRHYWEDEYNYYLQNWAWFGTALYTNKLPNLWLSANSD